jgi:hypothetical protein
MKLTKGLTIFLGFGLVCLSILGYFFNDYLNYQEETIIQKHLDTHLKELFEKLKERKNITLTAAMLLSNDNEIKECLKEMEQSKCVNYLKHIQNTFDEISFAQDIKIHVHTKDFRSFFRVWDLANNQHDSLAFFRESLQSVKENRKPIAGIEIGRYSLQLRGIAPIFDAQEYLGSIEVISNFDSITEYYKQKNIDFFVLMDKKYENIASKVDYPANKRFNHYIVVNNVNSGFYLFRDISFKDTGFVEKDNFYNLYTPIYSLSNEKVGFYVLKIPKSKLF